MKKLIILFLLIPLFLIGDEKKYDFTITISVNDRTLKESFKILSDFEEVAKEHNVSIELNLNEDTNKSIYFDGRFFNGNTTYELREDNLIK